MIGVYFANNAQSNDWNAIAIREGLSFEAPPEFRMASFWGGEIEPFEKVLIFRNAPNSTEIAAAYRGCGCTVSFLGGDSGMEKSPAEDPPPISEASGEWTTSLSVGIFENTTHSYCSAFIEGVLACGDSPVPLNPSAWGNGDHIDLSAAVLFGGQAKEREIANHYRALGTPLYFVELGHIYRCASKYDPQDNRYFQLGFGKLNWIPPHPCPDDRRLALGITKPRSTARVKDGHILLLGQKPGDAQHNIADMVAWRAGMEKAIRKHTKRPILWRPHPKDANPLQEASGQTLEEAFAGAWAVVTHNSNAGLKAILAGLPVVCDETAIYSQLGCPLEKIEKPPALPKAHWEAVINRICYAQWTPEEFRTGEPWRFVKSCL